MPGFVEIDAQSRLTAATGVMTAGSGCGGAGIWSRRREEITFDRLDKFWSALPLATRQELLRIDKQALFEQARKNMYCSRCSGLLLESFSQIVVFGKSMPVKDTTKRCDYSREKDGSEDLNPVVHPWGGLASTKDGVLTLLDCFINAASFTRVQNIFDNARAREREREMLYPDACGAGCRGWISQGMSNHGRGLGTRETCALHTSRLSCDTLVDFWSALSDDTRFSLLRMKEEDFIERLMRRFDSKRFCRDCRRNVIREFKELKELKRMRKEPRCNGWFCVPDTEFDYEVSDDTVFIDWHQYFSEMDGSYHHFEWAVGSEEDRYDILDFEDVGMNRMAQKNGLPLCEFDACYITVRAWRLDGHCMELSVKAHALTGQSCVHQRMMVGDGYVAINRGESIRRFFEHAEEAEEDDVSLDGDATDKDGRDFDGETSHPQMHAKSPELAREFLLDSATVIFKEQVEKAFREGRARQNAHSLFVSLALKLLEDRLHVAFKEIITLEKQTKLLEEEEEEKREEEERRERKRNKEREKKNRRKERLREKEKERDGNVIDPNPSSDLSPTQDSVDDSISDQEDCAMPAGPSTPSSTDEQLPCEGSAEQSVKPEPDTVDDQYQLDRNFSAWDCTGLLEMETERPRSSRRQLRYRREPMEGMAVSWYEESQDESSDAHMPSREKWVNHGARNVFNPKYSSHVRYEDHSCSYGYDEDYSIKSRCYAPVGRSVRDRRMTRNSISVVEQSRLPYSGAKYKNVRYPLDNRAAGMPYKMVTQKQVWEPLDSVKKGIVGDAKQATGKTVKASDSSERTVDCNACVDGCKKPDEEQQVFGPRSHESCEDGGPVCDESSAVDSNCREEMENDASMSTQFTSSDNCSSCLSEGDSSTISSSTRNMESSSTSDSEESTEITTAEQDHSLPAASSEPQCEVLTKDQAEVNRPKVVEQLHNGLVMVDAAPMQEFMPRHHNVNAPPFMPVGLQFCNNQETVIPLVPAVPGFVPLPQPGHLHYSAELPPFPFAPVPYNYPHPLPPPVFAMAQQPPLPPPFLAPHIQNGVGGYCRTIHPVLVDESPKEKLARENCDPDDRKKPVHGSAPFSYFHFPLVMPCADSPSSEANKRGPVGPKASTEAISSVEYNPFSPMSGVMFSS